ncbi:hypothetical protein [Nocardia sp. N2S4-5]|uniref:hypothetical protein n=1 Tax=Nocardia sp. N2S4-5 TaxID=3351565 RepID=UPI0037D0783B
MVLLLFGGCVSSMTDQDKGKMQATTSTGRTVSTSAAPKDPTALARFVATIDGSPTSYRITVKVGTKKIDVKLAHTASHGSCGSELLRVFELRLAASLPIGASVTVVWSQPQSAPSGPKEAYIHLAEPGKDATENPYGISLNEQLVAEGNAVLDPPIRRSEEAPPVAEQVLTVRAGATVETAAYIDALSAADIAAWNSRVGAIADCRVRVDREDEQRRQRWGADRKPGTDDDPPHDYSNNGSSSGGGGGESRLCRRHWWC